MQFYSNSFEIHGSPYADGKLEVYIFRCKTFLLCFCSRDILKVSFFGIT